MKLFWSALRVARAMVVAATILVGGCDSPNTGSAVSLEQQIAGRAEARWKALSEGDFQSAYSFETPAYREVAQLDRYLAQYGSAVKWHGAEVKSVKLDEAGDTAQVSLALEYTSVMPSGGNYRGKRGIYEAWILAEGDWWYVRK